MAAVDQGSQGGTAGGAEGTDGVGGHRVSSLLRGPRRSRKSLCVGPWHRPEGVLGTHGAPPAGPEQAGHGGTAAGTRVTRSSVSPCW